MKKRRTLIISLLLIAALALGIGYAATSGNLTINGTVSTQRQEFAVYFTQAVLKDCTDGVVAKVETNTEVKTDETTDLGTLKSVQLDITGMKVVGDSVTVTFTVENHNAFPMYINNISVTNAETNAFAVTTSLDNVATQPITLAESGQEGDSTTVDVTVTVDDFVSEDIKQSFTILIHSSAKVDDTSFN